MWKVVIADDDAVVRSVVAAVLDAELDFEVVGTAGDAREATEVAREQRPDIVVLDVQMPHGGGPAAARAILAERPRTRIVALSGLGDPATVQSMLDAGVERFAIKSAPIDELVDLLRTVVSGPKPIGPLIPARRFARRESARVLLAVEDAPLLLALTQELNAEHGIEIIGLAQTAAHARTLAARHRPDVALVDAGLMAPGGGTATAQVRSASPSTAVLALWQRPDRVELLEHVRSGARGHLHGATPAEVAAAVRELTRGGSALSPGLATMLVEELAARLATGEPPAQSSMMSELDRAARGDGMVTLVQPIVDLRDGRVVGNEALTRFTLEPRQATDVWLAEATASGRGREVELAAARRAVRHLPQLPVDCWLSVNISPSVVGDPEMRAIVGEHGPRVVLEMTEHARIDDYAELATALAPLRERGVRFAIDDAGAGFASLRHILLLAPDFIKLDISLCRGIGEDRARRAMARALVGFAAETGSTVIAEGIEQVADEQTLKELDVPLGQGYMYGRPAPVPF